jgi:hypothetical protein
MASVSASRARKVAWDLMMADTTDGVCPASMASVVTRRAASSW